MNGLHPIIRRPRRSLQPDALPAVTICPHCGRSSAEPASVTLDPIVPAAPVGAKPVAVKAEEPAREDSRPTTADEPVNVSRPNQSHDADTDY